jgi:hypothetical protein
MAVRTKNQFHGTLEQVNTADQAAMPVQMIEAIEIIVFVLVIFTVFFKFKNMISVNSSRKTPEHAKPEANETTEGVSISAAKA